MSFVVRIGRAAIAAVVVALAAAAVTGAAVAEQAQERQTQSGNLTASGSGTVVFRGLDGVAWGKVHNGTITVSKTRDNRVSIAGAKKVKKLRGKQHLYRYTGKLMSFYISGTTKRLRMVAKRTVFNVSGEATVVGIGDGTFSYQGEDTDWDQDTPVHMS